MARRPVPIRVKSRDLVQISRLLRGGVQQVRVVLRALALRLLAEGVTATQVAQTVPLTPKAIRQIALRIPAKANTYSDGNANGNSGPKANSVRSVATLALWLCRKCSASSRKICPELSGAQRRKRASSGERGGSPFPCPACRDPGEHQLDGSVPRCLRMESPRSSRR